MDWFEKLTGFRETSYEETRARLEVEDGRLRSRINGASYGIGELELVSLQALRERAKSAGNLPGRVRTSVVTGDVRRMHQVSRKCRRAVPSSITVQSAGDGVARCDAGTWRDPISKRSYSRAGLRHCCRRGDHLPNYFAPIEGGEGQTAKRQLDGLADLGAALSSAMKLPVGNLWTMQNGYALAFMGLSVCK